MKIETRFEKKLREYVEKEHVIRQIIRDFYGKTFEEISKELDNDHK